MDKSTPRLIDAIESSNVSLTEAAKLLRGLANLPGVASLMEAQVERNRAALALATKETP